MLDLLFDKNFWIGILIIVGIILLVYISAKYPNARWIIKTLIYIITIGATIYSGYQLYNYYSIKNKIFGEYQTINENNYLEIDGLKFRFNNVEMLATDKENEYSLEKVLNQKVVLERDTNYMVYVNDLPCDFVEISSARDYVIAEYQYNYYNDAKNVVMNDTLTLKFSIYTNGTVISATTNGGADAVSFWNSYFNKNNFVVELKEAGTIYNPIMTETEGEVGEYVLAKYYTLGDTGHELYLTQAYKAGAKVEFPKENNAFFTGWGFSSDSEQLITTDIRMSGNTNFYAKYDNAAIVRSVLEHYYTDGVLDLSGYHYLTAIPSGVLEVNNSLLEVKLPASVKTIKSNAFGYCTNLIKINLDKVERIEAYAFTHCIGLTNITIRDSIDFIDEYAFNNCTNLTITIALDSESEIPEAWSSNWNYSNNGDKINTFYKGKDELGLNYIPVNTPVASADAFATWTYNHSANVNWYLRFNVSVDGSNTYTGIYEELVSGFAGMTTVTTEFTYTIEDNRTIKLWIEDSNGEVVEYMTLIYTHSGDRDNLQRYLTTSDGLVFTGPSLGANLEIK